EARGDPGVERRRARRPNSNAEDRVAGAALPGSGRSVDGDDPDQANPEGHRPDPYDSDGARTRRRDAGRARPAGDHARL
ncbi:MAG: hypothetical protein AVDCRST_MAG59-4593, partial [uncultured Thermomicrobiales bacterium]